MAVKLHRCPSLWVKVNGHPCWKVQKALDEQGIDYEVAKGPWPSRKTRFLAREARFYGRIGPAVPGATSVRKSTSSGTST